MEHNTIPIRQSTLDSIALLDYIIQSPGTLSELFATDRPLFSLQQQHIIHATVSHQTQPTLDEIKRQTEHALNLVHSLKRDIAETELSPASQNGAIATKTAFTELERVTNKLAAQIEKCTLHNQEDGMFDPSSCKYLMDRQLKSRRVYLRFYVILLDNCKKMNHNILRAEKQILHNHQAGLFVNGFQNKFDKTYWEKTLKELREYTDTISTISGAYYQ
ncbi:hypothetical protein J3Q64DRAFT_1819915 [Phycomyces blakesleeanus]|uniref:Uncharacterized protein n=1 Tax=Phycomyces blakesleeanus TaxID=4837 RepID=A0ABR3B5L8_PHYBL